MKINDLLSSLAAIKASDLHLSSNLAPWFRINGSLIKMDLPVISHEELEEALLDCMDEVRRHKFNGSHEIDFIYVINENRFRVNVFRHNDGIAGAFRVIPPTIPSLEQLRLPEILKDIVLLPRGLVLITGPTGSGKSTTLASMINYLNDTKDSHVITIEDPIEFIHVSNKCLINQREIYRHTNSFSVALRSVLREDPNVILVGEMRDLETIRLALTAAETGHLVLATLHTLSAAKSIARVIDVFPGEERDLVRTILSEALQAVVSQTLVPKIGNGRIVATEVMICTSAIRNLIREDKLSQAYSMIQTGAINGMHTLDQHLLALVKDGMIEKSVAHSIAHDRELFK